jgi:hypothetical protein
MLENIVEGVATAHPPLQGSARAQRRTAERMEARREPAGLLL